MSVNFRIDCSRVLSSSGELNEGARAIARDTNLLESFYRAMTRARVFDGKAIALQRTGQLGTFASALGQEAIGVGVASAMLPRDVLAPSYRDHAAQLLRGMMMVEILLYWGGDERGGDYAVPRADFPICVPVGTQVAHAVGAAYTFLLRKEDRVAVSFIGDGGTGNGAFYEALNMAGVWKAPVVIVINNNRWAISTPRDRECAAETLAQKAIGVGVEGLQVDGNDVIAVYQAARQAIEKARGGGGPTLIEAVSYRLGDHTTADDATRYRDPEDVRQAWAREPIGRLRTYLVAEGLWTKDREDALLKQCAAEVEQAVATYLATPAAQSDFMFDHLYAAPPFALRSQIEEARRFAPRGGATSGAEDG
ncbi:MAG: pyruvate dehydrogenase (acetyl-transferring) E1 component subunit alpha [Methylocystis sp.]